MYTSHMRIAIFSIFLLPLLAQDSTSQIILYEVRAIRADHTQMMRQVGINTSRLDRVESNLTIIENTEKRVALLEDFVKRHADNDKRIREDSIRSNTEVMQWVRGTSLAIIGTFMAAFISTWLNNRHNKASKAIQITTATEVKRAINGYPEKMAALTSRVEVEEVHNMAVETEQLSHGNRLDKLENP